MAKPEITKQSDLGALGVRIVDGIVHDELGLIFRPREKRDLGIDGEIELVEVEPDGTRRGTGRLVALQIKCSRSYLSECEGDAFVYRGDLKHLEYWSDFSLPVLVVLCDPDTRQSYWAEVTPGAATRLETDWKILVPKANLLADSKYAVERIGGRNGITDVIDLCVQAWFHARYSERVEFCGIFAMPEDYHWYRHLISVGGEQFMVHWLYARYGRFEQEEIQAVLSCLPGNLKHYGKKLILCLVAESADAFLKATEWREGLVDHPSIEIVKLIFDRAWPQMGEFDGVGTVITEYFEGEPIYEEDLEGNWLG